MGWREQYKPSLRGALEDGNRPRFRGHFTQTLDMILSHVKAIRSTVNSLSPRTPAFRARRTRE